MYDAVRGILNTLPPENVYLPNLGFPGTEYQIGAGLEQPGVFIIQQMLDYISLVIPAIPPVPENGIFDEQTERSVIAFQTMFGLPPTGIVDEATWNELERVYREQRYGGVVMQPPIL